MADDMGACDLGYYGNADANTPHLDALAAGSWRHEAFYVTPVCAPTRAAFLTGRHPLRVGVSGVHGGKDHIHLEETLLPELLRAAGYATGTWGKWHSGVSEGYLPHQRGFDETLLLRLYRHRDPVGSANGGEPIHFDGLWGDDVIVDHALDFARRRRGQPFFGLVASMTPHAPLDAPEEAVEQLRARGLSRNLAVLHTQMTLFDRAIGRLLQGLKDLDTHGRETMVLFFSDNGPAMLEDDFTDADRAQRNGLGWRGWKGDVWENGVRSPLFVHRIGSCILHGETRQVADVTDLLPTIAAWAGASLEGLKHPLDGHSLAPMFTGQTMPSKSVFSWTHPAIPPAPNRGEERRRQDEFRPLSAEAKHALAPAEQVMALRDGAWKLTRNGDLNRPGGPHPRDFLANLDRDPSETNNLAVTDPERANTLGQRLAAWFEEIKREPRSFQPPELQIPARGSVLIQAQWTCRLSPSLYNNVPATEGFNAAGQRIAWSVNAHATREFTARLQWLDGGSLPGGARLALRCSGSEIIGVADADGTLHWDALLSVDAGPNTLELEILAPLAFPTSLNLLGIKLA